jgi:cell division protease FtsH
VCFGGRIAEEIFCGDITSGAQNDILQASSMVKHMVNDWGMSDKLGMVNFTDTGRESYFMGGSSLDCSNKTAEIIDMEISAIIKRCFDEAKALIVANKDKVEAIASALLKYETLDADEVNLILNGGEITRPTVLEAAAMLRALEENEMTEKPLDDEQIREEPKEHYDEDTKP